MGWIKILLAVLAVGTCSAVGFGKSSELSQRVQNLKACLWMIEKLQSGLQYERMTTKKLIVLLSGSKSLEPLRFLPVCRDKMAEGMPFPDAWKQGLQETKQQMNLEQEDWSILSMIGGLLGSMDAKGQLNELTMVQSMLTQNLEAAKQSQTEKGKLYRSLGVLSGIGLAILMI